MRSMEILGTATWATVVAVATLASWHFNKRIEQGDARRPQTAPAAGHILAEAKRARAA